MSTNDSPAQAVNLASLLASVAAPQPDKDAVVCPAPRVGGQAQWQRLTYGELIARTEAYAAGFAALGVTAGMRTVLMVKPGLDFLPLTFALFRIGAVPILIDPGMGRKNLLRCIQRTRPEAFVGIPLAHAARVIFRKYFRDVRIHVTIGKRWFWGGPTLEDLRADGQSAPLAATTANDLAAVIFTTGSTGPPKGVEYTHGMFAAQREMLGDLLQITSDDVDMPGFALFAMYTVMLGCTVVIPEMDPTRPANVTPARIVEAATDGCGSATLSFGSPALWRRVGTELAEQGKTLPDLKRVVMAGAPIPPDLHDLMLNKVLGPEANIYTPYGATECLPVTCFTGREVLAETDPLTRQGRGYCVGKPLPRMDVRIIRYNDAVISKWTDVEPLADGEIGEVVVRGPNVSRRYFELPEQTALHKIYETEDTHRGPFWHRIGDLGYFDESGRLWFCGRKAHRVETGENTLYTVCCEAIFNEHPRVARSALVGIGDNRQRQTPVLIAEPIPGEFPGTPTKFSIFSHELRELAEGNPLTRDINIFLFNHAFPVDIRHNAKIFREKLARWVPAQPEYKAAL